MWTRLSTEEIEFVSLNKKNYGVRECRFGIISGYNTTFIWFLYDYIDYELLNWKMLTHLQRYEKERKKII